MLWMLLLKRGAVSVAKTALLAVMVVAVVTALVPRGSSLRHLVHPSLRVRVLRNHIDRSKRVLIAARSVRSGFAPVLVWISTPEISALAAAHLAQCGSMRLRAPPLPS